nr:hypothetical protein DM860_008922 [Ipomoea batatas]
MAELARRPASTMTTLLYYSDLLPRNLDSLERLVRNDLVGAGNNYLFHFIIHFLRCFW